MLPDCIIIGTMKGGTTSLYHYLASHPDVVPSAMKETDFFLGKRNFSKGLDWYESQFRGQSTYAFEASPNYTKRHLFPGVAERMHSVLPAAKLIYVLRDPLQRVLSHYVHNYAHGRENQSLSVALAGPENNYLLTSRYFFQLQAFLDYYPAEQILLIESEALNQTPAAVVDRVFTFLGISPDYDSSLLGRRFHESSLKRRQSPLERYLSDRTTNPLLHRGIQRLLRPLRQPVERPTLTDDLRDRLVAALAPDVAQLRQFSHQPFDRWSL